MNKRFNSSENPALSAIVDQIKAELDCPKFKENSNLIDIDTWENIKPQMPRHRIVAEKGFGFCISNFRESGTCKGLIVINMNNCMRVNFTEREITAVIFHELGHLLNWPELEKLPTRWDCLLNGMEYSEELIEDVRSRNLIKDEIYADSYANQHGYGADLIATFHKQNDYFEQKIEYFEKRCELIEKGEYYEGTVVNFNSSGLAL